MDPVRRLPVLALIACLAMGAPQAGLAAESSAISNAALIGTWSGEVEEGTSHRRWILHLNGDGSFYVDMHSYYRCHFNVVTREAGSWTGDAGHFIVRVETVDGKPRPGPHVPDVYNLVWLSHERMVYAFVRDQTIYTAQRVVEDYAFEGCYAPAEGRHSVQSE